MTVALEIGGVDVLDSAKEGSLSIEETGISRTGVLEVSLFNVTGLDNEQTVEFEDTDTGVHYLGVVRHIGRSAITPRSGIATTVRCQDRSKVAYDRIITRRYGTRKTDETDKARIAHFFALFLPSVDAATHVVALTSHLSPRNYTFKSLGAFLDELGKLARAYWYIDPDDALHYFRTEELTPPFALSDTPNMSTSFPWADLTLEDENTELNNRVYTKGKNLNYRWYTDPDSIDRYGVREGALSSLAIKTRSMMNARAASYLGSQAWPKRSGSVTVFEPGIRPQMSVLLTASEFGLSAAPCLVTAVRTKYPTWKSPRWELDFVGHKDREIP